MLLFESKDRWRDPVEDNGVRRRPQPGDLELYLRATQGIIDANIRATTPPSKFKVDPTLLAVIPLLVLLIVLFETNGKRTSLISLCHNFFKWC